MIGMVWFFCLGSVVLARAVVNQIRARKTSFADILMTLGGLALLGISVQEFIPYFF